MDGGAHRGRPTGLVWQHHEHPRSVAAYQTVVLRNAPVNARRFSAHPGWPVSGGLGDFLGADPTVVRVPFIVLAVFGGAGLIIYLAMC